MADSFINTSFSAYPGNVHIPPRPVLCPPLLSLDTFCLVDLIFFHLSNHIPFVDNSQTSVINPDLSVELQNRVSNCSWTTLLEVSLAPLTQHVHHPSCPQTLLPLLTNGIIYSASQVIILRIKDDFSIHPNFHIQHSLNPAGVAS